MSITMTVYQVFGALINATEVGIPKPNGGSDDGLIAKVLLPVYFWAGVVAVIVIVVAGFIYTTSAGDSSRVNRAKNAILGAVVGLVFVICAFAITQIVQGGVK